MRQPPWSLVRYVFLEFRWLMPAGRPWQAGAGLLGLFALTFFRPFLHFQITLYLDGGMSFEVIYLYVGSGCSGRDYLYNYTYVYVVLRMR